MNEEVVNNVFSAFLSKALTAAIRLGISILVLIVSFKAINFIGKRIEKKTDKVKLDKTLAKTFAYVFRLLSKTVVIICLVGFVGIDTSGFAALTVSLGAGIGLALNGALSNLAGGILIILTRPFRVDDFIEAQGYSGTVEDIHITTTKVLTVDNKVVYVPNGPLSSGTIVNYSVKDKRRVDLTFSVGYNADFESAKAIIMSVFESHELILSDPTPMVRVSEHGENSIVLVARAWVRSEDYWTVKFDVLEQVKASFDKEGIEIPYNQLDVHLKKD